MEFPRPPSPLPPSLQIPDSQELPQYSQPPICTPIDQPILRTSAVTASPSRPPCKRRLTSRPLQPRLDLGISAPSRNNSSSAFLCSNVSRFPPDDDSLPTNSQSFSQRDLPDMSQDTLELLPRIVREEQRRRMDAVLQSTRRPHQSPPLPTQTPSAITTYHSNPDRSTSVARASLLSALSNADALTNPFIAPYRPYIPKSKPDPFLVSNASDSYQELPFSPSTSPKRPPLDTERKKLKMLLVASSQGRNIALDFKTGQVVGEGAFSKVWAVTHRLDGCRYAVKKNITPMKTDHARWDALQESFALAAVQGHPNVLRYQGAWFEDKGDYLCIQTEFISTGSLYSAYVQHGKRMKAGELLALAEDMSSVLAFIHKRGISHLDIKPDNIFRADRGMGRDSYILGDFGLACHCDGRDARSTEGDARYLRPEAMFEGSAASCGSSTEPDDELVSFDLKRGDIFSLGATLYELGTGLALGKNGQELASAEAVQTIHNQLRHAGHSPGMVEIVRKCLIPDPLKRATADEIREMVDTENGRELLRTRRRQKEFETIMRQLLQSKDYEREKKKRTKALRNCRVKGSSFKR